jgi:hypothetical protein
MRRRITYANVVATLALVLATSGGAVAASSYLITSTKQIKPSVLRALKGNKGKTGAKGAPAQPARPAKKGQKARPAPKAQCPSCLPSSAKRENSRVGPAWPK